MFLGVSNGNLKLTQASQRDRAEEACQGLCRQAGRRRRVLLAAQGRVHVQERDGPGVGSGQADLILPEEDQSVACQWRYTRDSVRWRQAKHEEVGRREPLEEPRKCQAVGRGVHEGGR